MWQNIIKRTKIALKAIKKDSRCVSNSFDDKSHQFMNSKVSNFMQQKERFRHHRNRTSAYNVQRSVCSSSQKRVEEREGKSHLEQVCPGEAQVLYLALCLKLQCHRVVTHKNITKIMEATSSRTNHDCFCCHSIRFASHLAKFELFLWIGLFILTFVLQEDHKDPIWLVSSISIFLFLLINTSLEIYGLSIKNFCLILSCGLARLCLIALGNLAVIVLAFIVDAMEKDQLT